MAVSGQLVQVSCISRKVKISDQLRRIANFNDSVKTN